MCILDVHVHVHTGTSRITLHKAFTCAILFGASSTTLHSFFYLCNIVSSISPVQEKYFTGKTLFSVVFEPPDNIA